MLAAIRSLISSTGNIGVLLTMDLYIRPSIYIRIPAMETDSTFIPRAVPPTTVERVTVTVLAIVRPPARASRTHSLGSRPFSGTDTSGSPMVPVGGSMLTS